MGTETSPSGPGRRPHRTLAEARELVAAWRSSGQKKESWCRAQGLLRSTLSSCLQRVEYADGASRPVGSFIAVRPPRCRRPTSVAASPALPTIAIELPDGILITGLDASGAALLIGQLGAPA